MKAIFESKSERIAHALIVFLMVLCCGVVILPFLNIIAVSLSGRQAVISGKVTDNGADDAAQKKVGFFGLVKQSMPALLT
ncbi:MAG: hypothetical protein KHX36_11680, partial [Clostridiales bacterium]|nr:hypothetical protein [Clostridiales bacterium]